MRNKAIKGILFSMATVAGFSATASEIPQGLHLLDELPIEQRVIAHEQVLKFLNARPEFAADAKVIAVDEQGTVYVLDEKAGIFRSAGSPSSGGI